MKAKSSLCVRQIAERINNHFTLAAHLLSGMVLTAAEGSSLGAVRPPDGPRDSW